MVRWLNAISYVIFPNLSVYIKWTEWYMFSFISSYLKKKGGGNLGWVDGLQLSTYHIPELVHPESVAVVTIVSLHIVFSDFINIL